VLLGNVLCLWFAIRHTTVSEYLHGPETLGMTPEREDKSYPLFGKIPVAPVMSAQIELILTLVVLRPLRKRILDELQKMMKANEPKYWFPIYLSCFILLHSCSLAMAWHYQYSRRNGVKVSNTFLEVYDFSAEQHNYTTLYVSGSLTSKPESLCYANLYPRASSGGKHSPRALPLLQQGQLSLFTQTKFSSFKGRAE
jgi:hypothetical protein